MIKSLLPWISTSSNCLSLVLRRPSSKAMEHDDIPNIPQYNIVGYDPETYNSEYIRDKDVVQPRNHMDVVAATSETGFWRSKTMGRCPTYGSCKLCFRSGPASKYCIECGEDWRYKIVFNDNDILNSITLAELMRTGHKPAKANQNQAWLRMPMMNVDVD